LFFVAKIGYFLFWHGIMLVFAAFLVRGIGEKWFNSLIQGSIKEAIYSFAHFIAEALKFMCDS